MVLKLFRWAVAAAAAIVLLGLLLVAIAHLPFVRAQVLERARAYAVRDLGLSVEADDIQYNLFTRSASLRNVTIAAAGQPPLVRADSAGVVVSRRLFRGIIEIERLDLVGPRITIVRRPDGTTNLPAGSADDSQPATRLELGTIDIRQLTFALDDRLAVRTVVAGPIDLRVESSSKSPRPGSFGPSPFTVQLGASNRTETLTLTGTLAGRLAFDGARLTAPELRVETPEGRISVDGWADLIADRPLLDARGHIALDVARARRFAGRPGDSLSGAIEASLVASGPLVDPALRFTLEGRDLAYRTLSGIRLSGAGAYGSGQLDVQRLQMTSRLGQVETSGSLKDGKSGQVTANWRGVDLDRLLTAFSIVPPAPLGSSADGRLSATLDGIDLSDPDWPKRLHTDSSMRLTARGTGLSLRGNANLALRSGNWSLNHALSSSTGRVSIDGVVTGRLTAGAADSTLSRGTRLRIDDLAAIVPILQQAGVSLPPRLVERVSGQLTAAIALSGTATRPNVAATIAARGLQASDVPATDLDATLEISRRALRARTLEARAGATTVTASGEYAWTGAFDATFDARANDLDQLMKSFAISGVSLAGAARLAGTASGSTQSPRVQATLAASGISVDGTPVGVVNATLNFANDRLQAAAEAPEIALGANARLDALEPYAYQAEASFDRTAIPALVPARYRDQINIQDGTIDGRLQVDGTLESAFQAESSPDAASQRPERAKASRGVAGAGSGAPALINRIEVRALQVRVGKAIMARASGSLGREQSTERLEVHVEGPLSDVTALAAPYLPASPIHADGSLTIDLQVGGTIATPEPTGAATIRAASLSYGDLPPATQLALDARFEPSLVLVDSFTAIWQQAALSAKAQLPLALLAPGTFGTPGTPGTLSARVSGISPAAAAPFLSPAQLRELGGKMSATITAEADAFALDRIRASLLVDEASLTLAGVPFSQVVPTRLRLADGYAAVDAFRWMSQGNELTVSGGAHVASDPQRLDLGVKGLIDLRVLGAFVTDIGTAGIATTDLAVTGPLSSPDVRGAVGIRDGEVRVATPPLIASDLNGDLRISAGRSIAVTMTGLVNGGDAKIAGEIDAAALDDPRGRLTLTARNVAVEYPDGFATESNADLTLALGGATHSLTGRIEILNGTYREPLVISSGLVSGLQREAVPAPAGSPILAKLRLNVTVVTAEDIRIDNNYGRLNLSANLNLVGTAAEPGAIGRIEATGDSEIYLAGNTYKIEHLVVDLTNRRAIAPSVSFLAETRVGSVPIEIELECPANGPCEREVRSQGSGVTNAEAEEMLFGVSTDPSVAGEQLARLLSGEILGIVGRTVGLDTLRLEQGATGRSDIFEDPSLVAGDVNPASRLTLGERLGENVELVYSQNLAESGFTWSTTYFAPYGISLRALLFDDQSRSYEFRHEPRFGRTRTDRPKRAPGARIADVRITGTPGFPENELRGRLKLSAGDRFEFGKWQEDRRRLEELYHSGGFLEARIRARRQESMAAASTSGSQSPALGPQDGLVLEYSIDRGPATQLEINGIDLPDSSEEKIRERWSAAVFDGFLERDARTIVRDYLYQQGRLAASVNAAVQRDDAQDRKTLRIDVTPGPELAFRLRFTGNQILPSARLYEVAATVGTLTAWLDPAGFEGAVERLYQEEGFLAADAEVLEPVIDGDPGADGASIVQVVIREGEPWTIGRVALEGTEALSGSGSDEAIDFRSGMRYQTRVVAAAAEKLERRFRQAGFLEAEVGVNTTVDDAARRVDLHVRAQPGPRSILTRVIVEGANPEKPLVARAIELTPGQPVSPVALGRTRRSLYDSGVFRNVEIALEPAADGATAPADLRGPPPSEPVDRPVVARVRLEERPRYRFRYGFALNDDVVSADERRQRLGFAADLENRNLFGSGAILGLSARIRRDQQVGRVNLGSNRFFGLPLRSNFFLSRGREDVGSEAAVDTAVSDVTEVSVEQSYRLRRLIELRYGYGLGRNRTFLNCTSIGCEPFDIRVRVARLTGGGLVDRRSNPLDPIGGWFTSATFELSRPGIGSDLSFLKSFLQYFHFMPIGEGTVLASAVRLGLARTFEDEELIPSERFFAGGATTVRGYREDDLGPRSIFGDAEGGRAMLILNAEARFPLYRWIRGVGFADMGNVYPMVGDISFSELLVGLGGGLRFETPIGLLRFDLAAPVNRRPFDPKWRVHFGLGHSF
jgi:outer membrane protein assembly complex protein YaeT